MYPNLEDKMESRLALSAMFCRLGGGNPTAESVESTGLRALAASWYRSSTLFEVERRVIFSARWLFITHRLRFEEPGDFIRYEEAGFDLFFVSTVKESSDVSIRLQAPGVPNSHSGFRKYQYSRVQVSR
jgi:hypothetical protein